MLSINPEDLNPSRLQAYLQCAVAPRPIALASTIDADGNPNLSPFSFFNVFSSNPPILVFSPARRVRDNTTKHTLENVKAVKQVVINMVTYSMVQQTSLSSTEYPAGINEFEKAGFTMLKSEKVKPFRVAESPVQMECKVNEIIALGNQGGAGNLVICEVIKLHLSEEILTSDNYINQEALDLVARAGGSYYSRAKQGFFEIPKPLSTLGIGVDAMPSHIKESMILTGNDLGMLGNVEKLPTKQEVKAFIDDIANRYPEIAEASHREKHKLAQNYLSYGDVASAWKILLS
ncbi:MAG TPA: flavin reductase family protein [Flavobacteriaceae bacterium]|nr:flavin reductase family protein [Flavobacteriaceae bacterium]